MKQKLKKNLHVLQGSVKYRLMLYTRKGDDGTTKLFGCTQGARVSKADFVFEVLGSCDTLNCMLGYAKTLSKKSHDVLAIETDKVSYEEILETFQQHLFCIQAEISGSDTHPTQTHILYLEKIIYEVETLLPPITSFIIPGGSETGAYIDIVRTQARKTERDVVSLKQKKGSIISTESVIYLNRLSSALYALARFANYQEGHTEHAPTYT